MHVGGVVDIPFPRSIRDALLVEGRAEEHHWVPNSGWITLRVRSEDDLKHSVWLMRLSYVRYALKTENAPRGLLEHESDELHVSANFRSLLEPFLPNTANHAPAEPVGVEGRGHSNLYFESVHNALSKEM